MNKRLALISVIIFAAAFFTYRQAAQSETENSTNNQTRMFADVPPQTFKADAFGITANLRDIAPLAKNADKKTATGNVRLLADRQNPRGAKPDAIHDADKNIARPSAVPMPTPSLSFNGISNRQNFDAYGFAAVPPDANGDVGPNHFVQSVNILSRVFDKNGNPLTGTFKLSDIFGILNTPCAVEDDGEPITLYDPLADRWILSQYCMLAPPFRQLIAVSQTADPTGAYFVYEFVMPNNKLNDFAKFGVWTDAYYMSDDEFIGSDFAGNGVFAFDKAKMLAGDSSAGYVYFDLPPISTIRLGGFLPSDLDGLRPPPTGAPNVFASYQATEYGSASDALRLFDFHADFNNPNSSTFVERAESPLTVAPFDPTSPEGRADILEPAPGDALDSQSDRLMYRLAYRNFGTHESLVVNQTVRLTPVNQIYRAGMRLYELQKPANGSFTVHEQATIGDTGTSRWMGSAAQDYQGNLAIGYTSANEFKVPSIFYTGKLAGEPAGIFREETALVTGSGVQTGMSMRWGDYSQMTVDPIDDCTFWMTHEYYTAESAAESPFGWLTRIGRFKFDECVAAPRSNIVGTVTNAATGQPIAGATVTANAVYTRRTDTSGSYGNLAVIPDTYVLTATAAGFRSQTVTVTAADGANITQNFQLQPTAVLSAANYQITAESCAINQTAEPSETITISVFLRNTGAIATNNLNAVLLPTGGVTNPGAAQNFGAIAVNGTAARSFTFTVSPDLRCGDALVLTLQLSDGGENLGTVTLNLNAGAPRLAFQENFDAVTPPNLPAGWTTAASGMQDVWKTSNVHSTSPPNAAYSFAANQVGINELVSPAILINSPNAELTFQNRYDLETTFLRNRLYDGSVLEIKIGNRGGFQDILAAGGTFISGGYVGALETCCQNPLGGRLAWSGKSGTNILTPEFITTRVKLPASVAGKTIRLRWRVGTDTGTFREGQFIDDVVVSDGFVCACQNARISRAPFDFDGDGKTDLSVFRPSDNPSEADFFVQKSSDNSTINTAWGSVGDTAVNADYDGDGKTDYAIFRPSSGAWFVLQSADNSVKAVAFGAGNDRLVPADYDGDTKADIAVYRPSNGVWYILQSSDNQVRVYQFGAAEDLPVQADYDGDGRADVAVFRPSNGFWYILKSFDNSFAAMQFGQSGDKPIAGDFDGDGKADLTVFRPINGGWYSQKSSQGFFAVQFGQAGDQPLQADFDGDGKRDIAVYRGGNGFWYYLKSSNNNFAFARFDAAAGVPVPTIFVP